MITLEQVEYIITELALKHNLVNSAFAGPSIYSLNADEIKEYPFIYVSPTGTHTLKENTTRFTFTIFAVDRLFEDSSNEDNIGSVSVETIRNLHLQLKKLEFITDIQDEIDVRLFTETEKMSDRCAGAYATIWLEVLNSTTCGSFFDEFDDYLGDYFNDYEIHNVLDALASKEYVKRLVAAASISGITPEEFEEILSDYVLEKNFATINGEKITNRKKFTLVDQSAYTQDIQNIYQAISGATPEDYSALQEQVSANTENISTLSAFTENVVSSLTEQREIIEQLQETDSLVFIIDERSTQADINALVEASLDTGNTQWGRITLFYKTNTYSDNGYVVLRPYYRYRPYTDYEVYFRGVVANSRRNISLFVVGFSRNTMQQGVDRRDYDMSKYVPNNEFRTINGQKIYGVGYGDFNLVSSIQNTITGIWSGTQNAYDAIPQKDPKVLYVING